MGEVFIGPVDNEREDGWEYLGFSPPVIEFGKPPSEDPGTHWFQQVENPGPVPGKLEFELTALDADVIGTIFGAKVPHYQGPEQSVLIEYTDTESGCPERPAKLAAPWWRPLRRRWLRRVNALAWHEYEAALEDWEAAGCPDRKVRRRVYVSRATIEHVGDDLRVTPRG